MGSSSNSIDNPINLVILYFNKIIKTKITKVKLSNQLEKHCKWLKERFKTMKEAEIFYRIDAKELNLVQL